MSLAPGSMVSPRMGRWGRVASRAWTQTRALTGFGTVMHGLGFGVLAFGALAFGALADAIIEGVGARGVRLVCFGNSLWIQENKRERVG